jgi:uncharacterized protein
MVGLGGGFLIVPILRLFFGLEPAAVAGTSLALVVANSASGTIAYALQRRVHVRAGLVLAAAAFPGSVLGAIIVKHLQPRLFDWLFAAFIVIVAIDIVLNSERRLAGRAAESEHHTGGMAWVAAMVCGFGVGVISSLFGVGGGVVLIPSLIYFSELPAHAITATSQFVIMLTSPVGLYAHYVEHDIYWKYAIPLVVGGLLGGPIGARISRRLHSPRLMGLVAFALVAAALALVARNLFAKS